jgi:hypothetical protein
MTIYHVEFGSKSSRFASLFSCSDSSLPNIYVLAETYNQAIKKALAWASEQTKTQSCLNEEGSLELPEEVQISSIGIFSQNVVA